MATATPTKCPLPILLGFFTWQVPNLCIKRWHLVSICKEDYDIKSPATSPVVVSTLISGILNLLILITHSIRWGWCLPIFSTCCPPRMHVKNPRLRIVSLAPGAHWASILYGKALDTYHPHPLNLLESTRFFLLVGKMP